jgi:hypothetical protein
MKIILSVTILALISITVAIFQRNISPATYTEADPASSSKHSSRALDRENESNRRTAKNTRSNKSITKSLNSLAQLSGRERLHRFKNVILKEVNNENWIDVVRYLQERESDGHNEDEEWRLLVEHMSLEDPHLVLTELLSCNKLSMSGLPLGLLAEKSPDEALKWYDDHEINDKQLAASLIKGISATDISYAENLLSKRKDLLSYGGFNLYIDARIENDGLAKVAENLVDAVEQGDELTKNHPNGAIGNMVFNRLIAQANASGNHETLGQFAEKYFDSPAIDDNTATALAEAVKRFNPQLSSEIAEYRLATCKDKRMIERLQKILGSSNTK